MHDTIACPTCQAPLAVSSDPCPHCHAVTASPPLMHSQAIQTGAPPATVGRIDEERRLSHGIMRPPQGHALAWACLVLLFVSACVDGLQMGAETVKASSLHGLIHGGNQFERFRDASFAAKVLTGVSWALLIATTAAVMYWLHSAYNNLFVLRVSGLTYTAAQAVATCFRPWGFVYLPHRVIQEIWLASDPVPPADSDAWKQQPASWLIRCWWCLFLLRNIRIDISISPFPFGNTTILTVMLAVAIASAVACFLGVIAAILFALILTRLQGRQWQRFENLQESA